MACVRAGWASLRAASSASCTASSEKKEKEWWPWAGHRSILRRLKSRQGANQSAHLFTHGMSLPSAFAVSCIYPPGSAWWTDKHFCCFNQDSYWLCHGERLEKYPEQPPVWILNKPPGFFPLLQKRANQVERALQSFSFVTFFFSWNNSFRCLNVGKIISCVRQIRWRCYLTNNWRHRCPFFYVP